RATYPGPRVPAYPVLSFETFAPGGSVGLASVLDARWVLHLTYGRMAIGLALKHMGIKRGDSVLLPAYHCLSMVDPVLWAGAQARYYRVREDTSVDLDDIQARIDGTTRALLVPHFFGFPQDMAAIRAFCDAKGLVLIEDCAHVIFGDYRGMPL